MLKRPRNLHARAISILDADMSAGEVARGVASFTGIICNLGTSFLERQDVKT